MGCTIVNFDEVSFRLVPTIQKVWAPIGSKPKGIFFWSNKKVNMFGGLIDGKELVSEWYEKLNTEAFISFMERFIKKLPKHKKYVFIYDNGPCHKSKKALNYLYSLGENYKIEFLPPYSPQLNVIESCWKIIRHDVTNSTLFENVEMLKTGIDQYINGHFFSFNVSNYLIR